MLDEGVNPNSMSNRDWQMAREERVKANRAARGPQAYDQAQGKLIPSPRAQAQANAMTQEKWDAQEQARVTQAAEDKKRQGVSAEDYWERNPTSTRTASVSDWSNHPAVAAAIKSGDTSAIEKATKQARDDFKSGKNIAGFTGPTRQSVDVADLASTAQADRLAQESERGARAERRAEVVENYRGSLAEERKKNEQASRDRFDRFIIAQDQRKTDQAKAEAYLKNFNRQARAMRRAAVGNSYAGKEGAEKFWELNADIQATAQNMRRMSQEDRLKWAGGQVKAEEEARANKITTASSPSVVTEKQVAEFFNKPLNLTDFVNIFFGRNRQ
jgi:hypothetical protein